MRSSWATVIAADNDEDGLALIAASHKKIFARPLDVSDSAAVKKLVAETVAAHGQIDAAVLGAAIQRRAAIEDITDEDWSRHMAVNTAGVFYFIRALAPVMKAKRLGAIVCFTSGLAGMGCEGAAAYAASKGALIGLVKCAALELRMHGVRVNVLSPGLAATPIFLNAASEDEVAMYAGTVGVSEPEAVAPSVLYLISDASANMTGAVIERRLVPR